MAVSTTTSLELDPEIKAKVQRLADLRRRSAHWVLREAVEQYVVREEERERSRLAAVESWDDYSRTGLHVTGEEVGAWLAKLEAGEDAPPPECHG